MMTQQEELDWGKIIKRKIEKKNYATLKRNATFKLFYTELQNYFSHHNMPVQLQLKKEKTFYVFDSSVKCSKYTIIIFDKNLCKIELLPHPYGIELFKLEMYKTGTGLGTIFMTAFNEVSKKTGVVIYLKPGDPGFTRGENNKRKRLNFYQKFNFKQASLSMYWTNSELIRSK